MPSNLDNLHALNLPPGLTGKGVKVAVIDGKNLGPYDHAARVIKILKTVAPDVEVIHHNTIDAGPDYQPAETSLVWCIENGVRLVNMSIERMVDNLREAYDAGVVMVACAGNSAGGHVWQPAASPYVIAVGGYDIEQRRIEPINSQGQAMAERGILMPGRWYGEHETSFYTPVATAVLALYAEHLGRPPTPDEAWDFLRANAQDIEPEGPDRKSGAGLFVWPDRLPGMEAEDLSYTRWLDYDLSTKSMIDPAVLDKFTEYTVLKGLGAAFVAAEEKYGINARYLLAHAIHESGWGTSWIAQNKRNLFGYGAYDGNPDGAAWTFGSFAECIDKIAGLIKKHYLTPGGAYYVAPTLLGMNENYATDPTWAVKIARIMSEIPEEPQRGEAPSMDYKGHWAKSTIEQVKALGLMSGDPDGKFRPDDSVTRAELATALLLLYNKVTTSG